MDAVQLQKEVTLIKEMIEKTRRATAESGHLLIYIGLFSALATTAIGLLEIFQQYQLIMPTIILMTIVNALIGFLVATRKTNNNGAISYPKTIFWQTWMACGLTTILIVFLFPNLGLYPVRAVPILAALLLGIAVFLTGTIFELRFIQLSSLVWWIAALLMSLIVSPYSFLIMVAAILIGWTLPGFILHRNYKQRS